MKLSARILVALTAAVLCTVSCSRGPRVISPSKMEKICSDMLMADQWIASNLPARVAADTTLFYEPIFQKYGYTTEDFNASIEYYMRDPVKLSRIMKKVALKLDTEAQKIQYAPLEEETDGEENETE